jgi:hypothetical protein
MEMSGQLHAQLLYSQGRITNNEEYSRLHFVSIIHFFLITKSVYIFCSIELNRERFKSPRSYLKRSRKSFTAGQPTSLFKAVP